MIAAAAYGRKSTTQDEAVDESSVPRQVEAAQRFAAARGWTLDPAHIYTDSNSSGAEFARRPGLMRLMAALTPRAPFTVLIVTDRDRLGREQVESAYLLKQLLQAGVRVFECAGEGREITLATPTDKIIMAVQGYAAEVEREQARTRTRAALEYRARAGRSTGGRIFGYKPALTADKRRTRAIVEHEAVVVRRVFQLAADGFGVRRIAAVLNAEAALAPRKARRSAGWAPSTVRGVLGNALYRGEATWGQTRKRDVWGQRRLSRLDEAEVVRVAVPEWRIVPEELWQRAHARREAGRALYFARAGGPARGGGRPPSGSASRYLLSGLGLCACCGGSMFVHARGRRAARWECMTRHLRGPAACGNRLTVRLDETDTAVLAAVEVPRRGAGGGDGLGGGGPPAARRAGGPHAGTPRRPGPP